MPPCVNASAAIGLSSPTRPLSLELTHAQRTTITIRLAPYHSKATTGTTAGLLMCPSVFEKEADMEIVVVGLLVVILLLIAHIAGYAAGVAASRPNIYH